MFKRAFLAAIAVLMMPALAMAQSTVTFEVGVEYDGLDSEDYIPVEATLTCNAGLPLEQVASVGEFDTPDAIIFTVTELPDTATCTITFADAPAGWQSDGYEYGNNGDGDYDETACVFDNDEMMIYDENYCIAYYEPAPVDFEVTVDWQISPDADVGVGMYAYAELRCWDLLNTEFTNTFLDAGPDADMPLVLTNLYPDPDGGTYCYATLYGTGSAVEIDNEVCWYDGVPLELGSNSSCTITATAFYEGVPTLSQYGMAIMVLLMLGMGFVGFRRFV